MNRNIILIIVMAMAGSVYAGGAVWLGNADPLDNLWMTGTNWQNGLPTSADTIYVTYDWTNGVNGPIVQAGDAATTDLVFLGWGGWGEGTAPLYLTGGTLNTREWWIGKDDAANPEAPGFLEISGGTLTNTGHLIVSAGCSGTVNQTGGDVITEVLVLDWLSTANPEYGVYNLTGGTLDVGGGGLHIRPHGTLDIEEGVMTLLGDADAMVTGYIGADLLTAYGGTGNVLYDYDVTNQGKTTVWAEVPEPATMLLLSLGGLLIRRKKA